MNTTKLYFENFLQLKLKHCTSLSQENKTLLTDQYWLTRGKGNTQKFTRYVG